MKPILTAILAVTVLALFSAVAQATPPEEVGGEFQVASAVPTSVVQVDGQCKIELETTFSFDGDLIGDFDAEFQIQHFGPCNEPAREVFQAQGVFVGSVTGEDGSFEFNFQGSIDADGNAEGQLVVLNGEAGLANLHGRLVLTGQAGVSGTYSGEIHFDPANG